MVVNAPLPAPLLVLTLGGYTILELHVDPNTPLQPTICFACGKLPARERCPVRVCAACAVLAEPGAIGATIMHAVKIGSLEYLLAEARSMLQIANQPAQ